MKANERALIVAVREAEHEAAGICAKHLSAALIRESELSEQLAEACAILSGLIAHIDGKTFAVMRVDGKPIDWRDAMPMLNLFARAKFILTRGSVS